MKYHAEAEYWRIEALCIDQSIGLSKISGIYARACNFHLMKALTISKKFCSAALPNCNEH
jgi:hypothetical protein